MTWRALTLVLSLALVAAAVPLIRHMRERPPESPPPIRAALTAPAGSSFGAAGTLLDAAISPDGTRLAFVATTDGRAQLWLRTLADQRAEALPGTEGAAMPAWKAGGGVIAFFAGGALKQIALESRRVQQLAPAPVPSGVAWLPDGSLVFAPAARGPLKRMRDGTTADETRLADGDVAHGLPTVTRDGALLYVATGGDGSRRLRYRRDEAEVDLGATSSHAELIGTTLVHVRDGVLFTQELKSDDAGRPALTGRAVARSSAVGVARNGRGAFAASARLLLMAPPAVATRELRWFDDAGRSISTVLEPGDYWQVRLSPDERQLAFTAVDPLLRTLDVFAVPVAAPTTRTRVSLSLGADSDPVWFPDSTRVVFRSLQRGEAGLLARTVGSAQREEVLLRSDGAEVPSDLRGTRLLLHAPGPGSGLDIWTLDLASQARTRLTDGAFNEWDARWSPDGRWLAYVSDESGRAEIYVDAVNGGRRTRLSYSGGSRPQWGANGREIYFMRENQLVRAVIADDYGNRAQADGIAFSAPETVLITDGLLDYAVADRRKSLAVLTGAYRAEAAVEVIADWRNLPSADIR